MYLVISVHHRRLGVTAHTCSTHFMDTQSYCIRVVVGSDVACPCFFQHLDGLVLHVLAHVQLVLSDLCIEGNGRQSPLVLFVVIQGHSVVLVRKDFPKGQHVHIPSAGG